MQPLSKFFFSALLPMVIVSGCATSSDKVVRVNNVAWYPKKTVDIDSTLDKEVPSNLANLVFFRKLDSDDILTASNISINDDYQVSLHPGNFTQVYSCIGRNKVSSNITELKTNDLLLNAYEYNLEGGHTYYFYIDVGDDRVSTTKQVTEESARYNISQYSMPYQSHQTSGIVPHCDPSRVPKPVPQVIIKPKPKPVEKPKPVLVLKEKVSIQLNVLFDTDKSVIKPEYFHHIQEVASFMEKYADTNAVIEGHTDSRASDAYNIKLSQRRADSIKLALVRQYGIRPERLQAVGFGESRPIASNETPAGRQKNRRVVAVIEQN